MNIQKFTQKSVEAVNNLEKTAMEYGNQEIEQEHLLYCLLTQEESLISRLISKMDIDSTLFKDCLLYTSSPAANATWSLPAKKESKSTKTNFFRRRCV